MERIGPIAKSLVLDNRCDACKVRYKRHGNDFCDYCLDRADRKRKMTPALLEKTVLELVEPLYANATMVDIDPEIRDPLRDRLTYQDVFLYGLPGVGKTYTMAALIRAYVEAGEQCIRISFDEFCCRVRSTMNPASKQTEWELTEELKSVNMLFIDDLGIGEKIATPFVYGTFYIILNKRQERLLPTFISSNKSVEALCETLFDPRIESRLSEALIIEMKGGDRRRPGIASKAKRKD